MAIPRINIWSLGALLADYLQKAGGTMTGALTLFGAPTDNLHAATKKYVDDAIAGVGYPAPRVLTKTSGTSLDLANVEVVNFNYGSSATISTFSNVVVDKIYLLRNVSASAVITVDRSNAYLNGAANQALDPKDVMLIVGRTATFIEQAAPRSDNG